MMTTTMAITMPVRPPSSNPVSLAVRCRAYHPMHHVCGYTLKCIHMYACGPHAQSQYLVGPLIPTCIHLLNLHSQIDIAQVHNPVSYRSFKNSIHARTRTPSSPPDLRGPSPLPCKIGPRQEVKILVGLRTSNLTGAEPHTPEVANLDHLARAALVALDLHLRRM